VATIENAIPLDPETVCKYKKVKRKTEHAIIRRLMEAPGDEPCEETIENRFSVVKLTYVSAVMPTWYADTSMTFYRWLSVVGKGSFFCVVITLNLYMKAVVFLCRKVIVFSF